MDFWLLLATVCVGPLLCLAWVLWHYRDSRTEVTWIEGRHWQVGLWRGRYRPFASVPKSLLIPLGRRTLTARVRSRDDEATP